MTRIASSSVNNSGSRIAPCSATSATRSATTTGGASSSTPITWTRFETCFGDEREPYEAALEQHYSTGADVDWSGTHVSQYATMHPWEDWAETFAHYLHIDAGLATASSIGLDVGEPARSAGHAAWSTREHIEIGPMVQSWLGLTIALNAMARSIGQSDLYPFVLSPVVVEKLNFVHRAIATAVGS